jgi:hypothetical protein
MESLSAGIMQIAVDLFLLCKSYEKPKAIEFIALFYILNKGHVIL